MTKKHDAKFLRLLVDGGGKFIIKNNGKIFFNYF